MFCGSVRISEARPWVEKMFNLAKNQKFIVRGSCELFAVSVPREVPFASLNTRKSGCDRKRILLRPRRKESGKAIAFGFPGRWGSVEFNRQPDAVT